MEELPGFVRASELPREESRPTADLPRVDRAHAEDGEAAAASPSPEAGRAWASGQLVFNAGSFESAWSNALSESGPPVLAQADPFR